MIQDLIERHYTAVAHVGRGQRHISQRRLPELAGIREFSWCAS